MLDNIKDDIGCCGESLNSFKQIVKSWIAESNRELDLSNITIEARAIEAKDADVNVYSDNNTIRFLFNLPKGEKGDKGDKGDIGTGTGGSTIVQGNNVLIFYSDRDELQGTPTSTPYAWTTIGNLNSRYMAVKIDSSEWSIFRINCRPTDAGGGSVTNPYELPIASIDKLGGIRVGRYLTIDGAGILSVDKEHLEQDLNLSSGGTGDTAIKETSSIFLFKRGVTSNNDLPIATTCTFDAKGAIVLSQDALNGWDATDSGEGTLFMTQASFSRLNNSSEGSIIGGWRGPFEIGSGNNIGEDNDKYEYVYLLSNYDIGHISFDEIERTSKRWEAEGVVPNNKKYDCWVDNPQGIDERAHYEYFSMRLRADDATISNNWSTPAYWSKWGVNGQDGDGVQYIYKLSNTNNVDTPTYSGNFNLYDPNEEYIPNGWADNPVGVSENDKYEFVSTRRFKYNDSEHKKKWTEFSTPALWGTYTIAQKFNYESASYFLEVNTSDGVLELNAFKNKLRNISNKSKTYIESTEGLANLGIKDLDGFTNVASNWNKWYVITLHYANSECINIDNPEAKFVTTGVEYTNIAETRLVITNSFIGIPCNSSSIASVYTPFNVSIELAKGPSNVAINTINIDGNNALPKGFSITNDGNKKILKIQYQVGQEVTTKTYRINVTDTSGNSYFSDITVAAIKNGSNGTNGKDGEDCVYYELLLNKQSTTYTSNNPSVVINPTVIKHIGNEQKSFTPSTLTSEGLSLYWSYYTTLSDDDKRNHMITSANGVQISKLSVNDKLYFYLLKGSTILDIEDFVFIKNGIDGANGAAGADALNVVVSNNNISLPTTFEGKLLNSITTESQVRIFEGSTNLSNTDSDNCSFTYSSPAINNLMFISGISFPHNKDGGYHAINITFNTEYVIPEYTELKINVSRNSVKLTEIILSIVPIKGADTRGYTELKVDKDYVILNASDNINQVTFRFSGFDFGTMSPVNFNSNYLIGRALQSIPSPTLSDLTLLNGFTDTISNITNSNKYYYYLFKFINSVYVLQDMEDVDIIYIHSASGGNSSITETRNYYIGSYSNTGIALTPTSKELPLNNHSNELMQKATIYVPNWESSLYQAVYMCSCKVGTATNEVIIGGLGDNRTYTDWIRIKSKDDNAAIGGGLIGSIPGEYEYDYCKNESFYDYAISKFNSAKNSTITEAFATNENSVLWPHKQYEDILPTTPNEVCERYEDPQDLLDTLPSGTNSCFGIQYTMGYTMINDKETRILLKIDSFPISNIRGGSIALSASNSLRLYFAGYWASNTVYYIDGRGAPYVYYNDGYYLWDYIGTSKEGDPPISGGILSVGWYKLNVTGNTFTKSIIASKGQIGTAAFYGNWMFSMQGVGGNFKDFDPRNDVFPTSGFIPNYALNSNTGEVYACGGKVRFNKDGSALLAGGNIRLNADGSGNFANRAIAWDANGNAINNSLNIPSITGGKGIVLERADDNNLPRLAFYNNDGIRTWYLDYTGLHELRITTTESKFNEINLIPSGATNENFNLKNLYNRTNEFIAYEYIPPYKNGEPDINFSEYANKVYNSKEQSINIPLGTKIQGAYAQYLPEMTDSFTERDGILYNVYVYRLLWLNGGIIENRLGEEYLYIREYKNDGTYYYKIGPEGLLDSSNYYITWEHSSNNIITS